MNQYVTGAVIKKLREERNMTQLQLADRLAVSAKTVSKWETAKGYPDITLLETIADVLSVSVTELISGNTVVNSNVSANMLRSHSYVCPVCGNIIHSMGETVIQCHSCLQKIMGKVYVTNLENPKSALAFVGCFVFYAGTPDMELIRNKPEGFVIMIPQNKEWEQLIEQCYPSAKRVIRYAIKKDTIFDKAKLKNEISKLPAGYEIHKLDEDIYDQGLENPATVDFVSTFESKEKYLQLGRGMVIL